VLSEQKSGRCPPVDDRVALLILGRKNGITASNSSHQRATPTGPVEQDTLRGGAMLSEQNLKGVSGGAVSVLRAACPGFRSTKCVAAIQVMSLAEYLQPPHGESPCVCQFKGASRNNCDQTPITPPILRPLYLRPSPYLLWVKGFVNLRMRNAVLAQRVRGSEIELSYLFSV